MHPFRPRRSICHESDLLIPWHHASFFTEAVGTGLLTARLPRARFVNTRTSCILLHRGYAKEAVAQPRWKMMHANICTLCIIFHRGCQHRPHRASATGEIFNTRTACILFHQPWWRSIMYPFPRRKRMHDVRVLMKRLWRSTGLLVAHLPRETFVSSSVGHRERGKRGHDRRPPSGGRRLLLK